MRVIESYAYAGRGGRVSSRDTEMRFDGTPRETFTQGWEYDELGEVSKVIYPRCTHSFCEPEGTGPDPTVSRQVTSERTNGFRAKPPAPASPTTPTACWPRSPTPTG